MSARGSLRSFKRGSSLVTVLIVVALAVVLSSALIGSALFNLNLSVRQDAQTVARNLADSAISHAAMMALNSPSLFTPTSGVTPPPPSFTTSSQTVTNDGNVDTITPGQDYGFVTFAQQTQKPWSLYNLGTSSVTEAGFNGRTVPPNSLHLVGTGFYKGTKVVTEAIVYLPAFPYVLAAAGDLKSSGSLLVAGTQSSSNLNGSGLSNILTDPAASHLLPAAMANNLKGGSTMMLDPLGQSIFVSGDVQTGGNQVNFPHGMTNVFIHGSITDNADPIAMPAITVSNFDPSAYGPHPNRVQTLVGTSAAPMSGTVTLSGYGYSHGDLYVQGGTLNLDGGVLYVNGDLNITNTDPSLNAVQGKGAIFTGQVNITGNTQLTSADNMALISQGDINLVGNGPAAESSPSFSGLLYAGGNLSASNMTIVGSYAAVGDPSVGKGNITLANVNLIGASDSTTVSMPQPAGSSPGFSLSARVVASLFPINVYVVTTVVSYDGSQYHYTVTVAVPLPIPHVVTVTATDATLQANLAAGLAALNVSAAAAVSLANGVQADATIALGAGNLTTPPTPISFPPGASGSVDPTFNFNQFIDPVDQARVLIWQTPTPLGPILPSASPQ